MRLDVALLRAFDPLDLAKVTLAVLVVGFAAGAVSHGAWLDYVVRQRCEASEGYLASGFCILTMHTAPSAPMSEGAYAAAIRSHEAAIMALKAGREADRLEGKLLPDG